MINKWYAPVFLIFIAMMISVFLNQDRIIRSFYNDSNKHAVPIASSRTFLGDEYHYYAEANDSLKIGFISKDKVYSTNNVLFGSLITGGLINLFCHSLIKSSDMAVLFSLILQTFLLVLATVYALKIIATQDEDNPGYWLGFWAFITLIFADYFLFTSYEASFHFRTLLSYYPNILRVINPQMGWAFGLVYFAILFAYLEKKNKLVLVVLSLLSLMFGFFSPSLCLTMCLAIALFVSWTYLKNKIINYPCILLGGFLLLSFLFNYLQLHYFQASPKGLEIGTGVVQGIVFKAHYFIFLFLLMPLAYYFKKESFLIMASVLISSIIIGAFCESLYLGERLWLRGAGIYVWLICIILVSKWLKPKLYGQFWPKCGILFLGIWTFFLLPHQFDKDYGYINADKWALIDWINRHIPPNATIMSEDLEFSFLLPIYTEAKPFVPLFSYSSLSAEETVKRYYYTLDKYGIKKETIQKLKDFNLSKSSENLQTVVSGKQLDDQRFMENAFINYLIYYPYTQFSKLAFNSEQEIQNFFAVLDKWSQEPYLEKTKIDYVILKANQTLGFDKRNMVFNSNGYQIIRNC